MRIGEVWFTKFPFEDKNEYKTRPAIILDIDKLLVLCVKVTKHSPREEDTYDLPILYWQEANLRMISTARISKTISIPKNNFVYKIGDLHPDDFNNVKLQFMKYMNENT